MIATRRLPGVCIAVLVGLLLGLLPGAAAAAAGSNVLTASEVLGPGEQLVSPDGLHLLRMQGDGNLVLYGPSGASWASRTSTPGSRAVMQADGNLVVYSPTGRPTWYSGTTGTSARVVLQDDGNLVLYDSANRPLWATGTGTVAPVASSLSGGARLGPGERLVSPNGRFVLVMQADGNLVLYGPSGAQWSSRTARARTFVVQQTDGNLVAYAPGGGAVWQTRTGGTTGSRTVLQDDGNLVLYRGDGLPAWYPSTPVPAGADIGNATQVVGVSVPSASSTTGTLTAWSLAPGGWSVSLSPRTASVGAAGTGVAAEGVARTPAGTFSLTSAFGRAANPGTALPYRVIDTQDWWVSDASSPSYNQYVRCAAGSCPFDESAGENLWAQGAVYQYAVVIDYNRARTPGAGSAIFLHVSNGRPTAGCVAVDQASLVALLQWLAPGAAPVIHIGVN